MDSSEWFKKFVSDTESRLIRIEENSNLKFDRIEKKVDTLMQSKSIVYGGGITAIFIINVIFLVLTR